MRCIGFVRLYTLFVCWVGMLVGLVYFLIVYEDEDSDQGQDYSDYVIEDVLFLFISQFLLGTEQLIILGLGITQVQSVIIFVIARIRETFCPSILVGYVYQVFLFHGSDIISIMVISLSGICNISLICNLMCSEWRWLLFISWLGYLRYGLSSSVLYGITISSVNPSVYSLV